MAKDTSEKVIEALGRSILYRRRLATGVPALERRAAKLLAEAETTMACGETIMLSIEDGQLQVRPLPNVDPLQMTVWESAEQEHWHKQSTAAGNDELGGECGSE